MTMHVPGVKPVSIACVTAASTTSECDELSVEEPLEIHVGVPRNGQLHWRSIAVTMRTPGADLELAAGFLFTEGIIRHANEIADIRLTATNIVSAALRPSARVDLARLDRQSFISSSCGVCGKRSIAAVFALKRHALQVGVPRIDSQTIHGLSRTQLAAQTTFNRTGGLHAAALFDCDGQLL